MFIISYHTKMKLRKFAKLLGILCLLLLIAGICMFFWLKRFIVYTRDGVEFDFDRSTTLLNGQGQEISPTENTEPVRIVYDDSGEDGGVAVLQPLSGYYADTNMLTYHLDAVRTQIEALAPGTAVMLDVKSIYGNFYYSTGIEDAGISSSIDIAAMDALIQYMHESGLYMIARVPAFCDSDFGSKHQSAGLPVSGGALWTDSNYCYWLDPTSATVLNQLSAIAGELSGLGFREVVFSHFYIPQDSSIVYDYEGSTEEEIISGAAENLVNAFMDKNVVISFSSDDPAFPVPSAISRLFLSGVDAAAVEETAAQASALTDPAVQLVFATDSRDTRFDAYSVLRTFTTPET